MSLRGFTGIGRFRPVLAVIRTTLLALVALGLAGEGEAASEASLYVRSGTSWVPFWGEARGVTEWRAPVRAVTNAVEWRDAKPGVEWAEIAIGGGPGGWRATVTLVRIDPARVRFGLRTATRAGGMLGAWTVDSADADAAVAFNAGQFDGGMAWGWLVRDGFEEQQPGSGPLSMAVVFDTAGAIRLVAPDSLEAVRRQGGVAQAFQSYPTILTGDGDVPAQLQAPGRGVDLQHRDIRLAWGEMRDGRVLIALTRFGPLADDVASLPFGPTVPEMSALMGALGCRQAVLLDGGLSGQLMVRTQHERKTWRAPRRVPLAITAG
jgi:hypothetical protein